MLWGAAGWEGGKAGRGLGAQGLGRGAQREVGEKDGLRGRVRESKWGRGWEEGRMEEGGERRGRR